jgi:membrane protease subunit HflK
LRTRLSRLSTTRGGRGLRGVAIAAPIGFALGWAVSGVYEVRPDQQAVVTRLGVVEAVTGPGLHAHLPWPLERAQTLAVTRIDTLNLGGTAEDGSQALTPTADEQLADVTYAVRWRIADPVAYLFDVADPKAALRLSAEAAMRQAVGEVPLAAAMGAGRSALERRLAEGIQQRLNRLHAGIAVTGAAIQAVNLPPDVQAAAGDVAIARQDAQAAIADGQAYRARSLAEARANAAKTLIDAESYRDQALREAQGAAARFEQLDAAYRKAPRVTEDRLYFETLQGVLARAHTIILDTAKGAAITLPPALLPGASPPASSNRSESGSGAKP